MEQVHLAAEPPVIAFLGFLDLLEIGVELFLLRERRAVDAREHLAVGIAAPIGARHLHQLEGVADLAGRRHVRAAAQVEPLALAIDADRLVFRNGIDQLDLELLAHVAERALGLIARPHFLGEGFVARDDFAHFFLDDGEIIKRERLVAEEVVVEAVLDHRPDGDLGAGPQALHGLGQHVGGVVADQFQRARIFAAEKFDPGVALDRIGEIRNRAVERHRHRALGERRRNALRDVETCGAGGELPTRAVGKGQRDHHALLLLTRCLRMQVSVASKSAIVVHDRKSVGGPPIKHGNRSCNWLAWSHVHGPADDVVMRPRRLLLSIVLSQICLAAGAQAQDAQPPAKASPPRSEKIVTERAPLLLYVARGEEDACGDGCGEWVVADGCFGQGSAQRFRTFLKSLSGRKLPVYFHSPGGLQSEALAIGRLMREREMTAGVAKTVPAGCPVNNPPDGQVDKACEKLKRSSQKVTAELRAMDANCNSACVYALIGAKVRHVPPGAILGVHASKLVRVARDGRVKTVAWEEKAQLARFNGELRHYVKRMGISSELFELAGKVAHEKIHRLSRDEIARFGIDDRAFQETHWTLSEKPPQPPAVFKLLAEARGPDHKEFRLSIIRLTCANATQIRTLYVRGL